MFIALLILISIMSTFALDNKFMTRYLPNYLRKVYDIHHVSAFKRGISKDDYIKGEFIQQSFGHFYFYARSTGLQFQPDCPIEETFEEMILINKWLLDSGKPVMEWEKFSFEYYLEHSVFKFVCLMEFDDLKLMLFGKKPLTIAEQSDSDESELDEIVDTLKATPLIINADGTI